MKKPHLMVDFHGDMTTMIERRQLLTKIRRALKRSRGGAHWPPPMWQDNLGTTNRTAPLWQLL